MSMHHNFFSLSRQLGERCLSQNLKIALSESCTGGLLSALLTEVPGSSDWFLGSAVVYSNHAKSTLLGVDSALIQQHGAVSEPVAEAMAVGALHAFHADLSLSITGVAGPSGGSLEKPIGTVCFALADLKGVECETMHFTSGRGYIRKSAAWFALEWLMMRVAIA